jgi:hypothetical protein
MVAGIAIPVNNVWSLEYDRHDGRIPGPRPYSLRLWFSGLYGGWHGQQLLTLHSEDGLTALGMPRVLS